MSEQKELNFNPEKTQTNLESFFVVALPREINVNIPGYQNIRKMGTTYAPTEATAVGNCLFRNLPRNKGRLVMSDIRDNLGGYAKHVQIIDNDYEWENNDTPMTENEIMTAQEIDVCYLFFDVYGRKPQDWLAVARKILNDH